MMCKKIVLSLLLTFISQWAIAGKIVVFDPREAILSTDLAQQRVKAFEVRPEVAQMIAQAESLGEDLKALNKEKSTKGITWSQEEHLAHKKKHDSAHADWQHVAKKIQNEQALLVQTIIEEMSPKMESALTAIIQSEDVDMVLKKPAVFANLVKPELDITLKVTEELNKQNK